MPGCCARRCAASIGAAIARSPRQVVLVGSGPLAAALYRQIVSDPLQNITVVGFVDSEPRAGPWRANGRRRTWAGSRTWSSS